MAAYAALASLLNNIDQIMNHSRLSTSLDMNQIQPLHEKVSFLLDFIEDYNYGGVVNKEVEDLERLIARAAHTVEDVIESHIVDQIHAGSSEVSPICSLHPQQIVEDMDAILRKANESKEKEGLREEQPKSHPRPLMAIGETAANAMVGFDEQLSQLMDELTNQGISRGRHTISIVGIGGMGKTTLAHNVHHHLFIKQHFDLRAWATVSHQYNLREILSQLLSDQARESSDKTDDKLGEELHKTLYCRRYLIVLDDLWSVEAWVAVRNFFPDNGNGSQVVLTTRLSNVASACGSSCFTMKLLDEGKSWKLFCKKAFKQETCPYPELERVGKEIAGLCRRLPLSTVVI